jgi:ligand-binding sensor domain-containing protein
LTCGDGIRVGKQKITIDHKDNVWCFGAGATCGVWIGNRWTQLDRSEFGGSSVWIIKEDTERRIWFGTENGVYIR